MPRANGSKKRMSRRRKKTRGRKRELQKQLRKAA
jgi:hypothetical protein